MSLERKDLRLKLDADIHAGLALISDVTERDMGLIAESLIVEFVRRRLHEASVLTDKAKRLGIAGSDGEFKGSGRE